MAHDRRPVLAAALVAVGSAALAIGPVLHDYQAGENHALWLLAYTNAIAANIPPSDPFIAGYDLLYHYFFNVHCLAVSTVTGVDAYVILRYLAPIFEYFLMVGTIIAAASTLLGSATIGAVIAVQFLAFYGYGSITYTSFQTANSSILYRLPSMMPAISTFLTSLVLITSYVKTGRHVLLAPMTVLFFAAAGFRANVMPIIVSGLSFSMLVCGVFFQKEIRNKVLLSLAVSISVFVVTFYMFYHGNNVGHEIMTFAPFNDSPASSSYREPSPVYYWLLNAVGSPQLAVTLFVVTIAAGKQFALGWFTPFAFRPDHWRGRFLPVFLLGIWLAGIAVLILFKNGTNEQWAFYIFAHLGLSFLLGDVAVRSLENSRTKSLAFVAGCAGAVLLVLQAAVYVNKLSNAIVRTPLFLSEHTITNNKKLMKFVDRVNNFSPRGVLIPYSSKSQYVNLFTTRISGISIYISDLTAHILKSNKVPLEIERRIAFISSNPRCDTLLSEAIRFRDLGSLYLFTDRPDFVPPSSCTELLERENAYSLYRVVPEKRPESGLPD